MKITKVVPVYAAGGCWMYYGQLEGGNWFYTSDCWGDYGYILNRQPSESEMFEDNFLEIITPHIIEEIEGESFESFLEDLKNWLVNNGYEQFKNHF